MSDLLFVEGKLLNARPTYFMMLLDLSLPMALCLVLIYLKLYFMLSTYVNLLHSSTYQSLYTYDLS
jgi:hypothetical protein